MIFHGYVSHNQMVYHMCRDSAVFSLKVILARDHVSVTEHEEGQLDQLQKADAFYQRKPAGTKKDSKRTQIASSSG